MARPVAVSFPRIPVSVCTCRSAVVVSTPRSRQATPSRTPRRHFSGSDRRRSDQFRRSDFANQGFTGYYEPGQPTVGPLGDTPLHGAPRVTPRMLKDHLDQFVVGQERAKKILSVAVYNHYRRVQELQRREDEEEALLAKQQRQAMRERHPVEDEFPGQQPTINLYPPSTQLSNTTPAPPSPPSRRSNPPPAYTTPPTIENDYTTLEKSNVLILGPSGVGKTLMAKTLAHVLEVPFSISDCTPFTQAGYIGEDVEVCVQRLLAAANYDVAKAERGIICLDEIDKIATARVSHGKDVSGEGVQQALLKIVEGTTVQVQAKAERSSGRGSHGAANAPPHGSRGAGSSGGWGGGVGDGGTGGGSSLSGGSSPQNPPNKGETYNVNTDNILFVCTGAFIGLHKIVMDRLAKGSMGFGARVRRNPSSTTSSSSFSSSQSQLSEPLTSTADNNDPMIPVGDPENDELFRKHLPFYSATAPTPIAHPTPSDPMMRDLVDRPMHNALDLASPTDLQRFGLIPELLGRLPITCALSPLPLSALVRVLTEPRNALLSQYTALFALSGIELRVTTAAVHTIARDARRNGTGARGLRTAMERVLQDAMFDTPGSGCRGVLVTEGAARGVEPVQVFGRRSMETLRELWRAEEDAWTARVRNAFGDVPEKGADADGESFIEWRERARVAGTG